VPKSVWEEEHLASILSRLTPISKGSVFYDSVSAGGILFASDLTPTNTPCIFRIYACFDTQGKLYVRRKKNTVNVYEYLNDNEPLIPNASYMFDIIVDSDESINLMFSENATCIKLSVVEIPTVL